MRFRGWTFIVGIVGLVAATAICSVGAFAAARQFAVDFSKSGVEVVSVDSLFQNLPTTTPYPTPEPTNTLPPGVTPSPTIPVPTATLDPLSQFIWQDPRRVNILLMGIDQRQGEEGPFHTDTMMVVSVDPIRKTAGLLSIPRDLYVDIPGFRQDRINQANFFGDLNNYPGGGPALAMLTVTQNLGIRVDKYVLINFDVFEHVVALVAPNGAEVCPPIAIDDTAYPDGSYGIIHVQFPAGCQRLQSVQLLQYARTRHTPNSDFDRALRQQEVLNSLREEVLNAGGIVNFLGAAPQLWAELSESYKTNLTLEEILSLGVLALEIPRDNIRMGQIGINETRQATTVDAEQVLIPVHAAMRTLLSEVFSGEPAPATSAEVTDGTGRTDASGPATTNTLGELRVRSEAENPRIVVYNNTEIAGLASQTREWLASRQVVVEDVGNMTEITNTATYIRNYTGKDATARYLAALLGIPETQILPSSDGLTSADVMVVVGSDIQPLLSGQTGN